MISCVLLLFGIMWWLMLLPCSWIHGAFSSEFARQISHRWRPIVHPTEEVTSADPVAFFDRDKMERYTRAMVSLQFARQGYEPFAILSSHEHRMCLFILHKIPNQKHSIQAVLWWEVADEEFCRHSAEQLLLWHQEHFPGTDLVLSSKLKRVDGALIREAWGI